MTIELISKGKLCYLGGQTIREQFSQLDIDLSTSDVAFGVVTQDVGMAISSATQNILLMTVDRQELAVEVIEMENVNFDIEC